MKQFWTGQEVPRVSQFASSLKDSTNVQWVAVSNYVHSSFPFQLKEMVSQGKITWQDYNMVLTGPGFKRNPDKEWPVNGRSSFSPIGGLSTTERRLQRDYNDNNKFNIEYCCSLCTFTCSKPIALFQKTSILPTEGVL